MFHQPAHYAALECLLADAGRRQSMRLLAYCLLPTHFRLVLWPYADSDLSRWMQWLLTAHVRRYHRVRGTGGHIWRGRFKAFPIQEDEHLLTVLRYVARNHVRAGLVARAESWRWSSLHAGLREASLPLHARPVDRPRQWQQRVNQVETEAELAALRQSVHRGTPFGVAPWTRRIAARLGLEPSLHPRGRPPKGAKTYNVPLA